MNCVGMACLNQPKQEQGEQDMVSKARYNRVRDDYNELLEKSCLDAIAANRWREHVTHCQLQGVDLDHNFAPQQRTWVGLTDQDIRDTFSWGQGQSTMDLCRAIEAKLKEKNGIAPQAKTVDPEVGDMFWNEADPEQSYSSIDEMLNDEWCNGSLEKKYVLQQANRLSNITVQVIKIDDESGDIEYEVIAAAPQGSQP